MIKALQKTIKVKVPSQKKRLREWSKAVRARDNGVCCVCKSTFFLQAHHLIEKRLIGEKKFDLNIGIALCANCHKFSPRLSPHSNPIMFVAWLREHRRWQYDYVMQMSGQLIREKAKIDKEKAKIDKEMAPQMAPQMAPIEGNKTESIVVDI